MSSPGRHLGDRVFDLEAGVDLHEPELPLVGVVEELDRAGVAVLGHLAQPRGRGTDLLVLLGGERGGRGFFEDLLVAALDGAVADADRPDGPWVSAMIWTSMWRAPATSFSTNTVSSPNAPAASARAEVKASSTSSTPSTVRIPRPPPPAVALIMSG